MTRTHHARRQQGFTLLEMMVGLVIGLMTTLAIAQAITWAERHRRTTMSGEDAQISGMLAVHALERDIRQAGYGLSTNPQALGCPLQGEDYAGQSLPSALAPVQIVDGAGAQGQDSITVFESSTAGASLPLLVTEDHLPSDSSNAFVVKSSFSARTGDYLVAVPETWATGSHECTVFQVSGIYTSANATCSEGTGSACTRVGHASGDLAHFPASGYPADSYLLNLGSTIRHRSYAVSGSSLQLTALGESAKDAFLQIVNLQAFYAKDTDGDGSIDTYDTSTPTSAAGWAQVLGIRLALVARSTHYEKDAVTTEAPQWDLGSAMSIGATTVNCSSGSGGQCLTLGIDHLSDWQHHRYKTFETMVPIRNSLWHS